jgi:hypothetical protein
MKLGADLREFIELLNSQSVDFLIVGAHALAWHGLPRYTKDIDFLVRADFENAQALIGVLEQFGFGSLGLQVEDFTSANQIVQLGREPNRIDLLTSISGVNWAECWGSKVQGEMDGLSVYYLGCSAYIKNKLASGRPQDLADASRLQEIMRD